MDRVHLLVTTALPDGSESSSQQEHNRGLQTLTSPPKSPDPNPIKHLWDALEQVRSTDVNMESAEPSDRAPTGRSCCVGGFNVVAERRTFSLFVWPVAESTCL